MFPHVSTSILRGELDNLPPISSCLRLRMVLGSGDPGMTSHGAQAIANLHIRRHDFAQGVLLHGLLFSLEAVASKNSGYSRGVLFSFVC